MSSKTLILNTMKEAQAQRWITLPGGRHVQVGSTEGKDIFMNVRSDSAMRAVSTETSGSRVFYFSQGDGSDLDKNVKFVTNTNADTGAFERGTLRVFD